LLGGSGAGKSTFARVLFERDELEHAGFEVVATQLDREQLGLVPQRGALFDHLDVHAPWTKHGHIITVDPESYVPTLVIRSS